MLGKDYTTTDIDPADEKEPSTEYEYESSLDDGSFDEPEKSLDIKELMNHNNVAELLEDKYLDELALDVIQTYDMDKESRSHREKGMEEAMDMALQVQTEKTFPWKGASSVTYPLITEAAITFAARTYPAIVRGDKIALGTIMGSDKGIAQPVIDPQTGQQPIDPNTGQVVIDPQTGQPPIEMAGAGDKKAKSKRISAYMNYQLMEEIDGWEEDTDKLLTALPIVGNMYRKLYWNAELGRPEASIVYPRHLVVNYKAKSLERAPRITEEVELYPHEMIERIRLGTFVDFNFAQAESSDEALSGRDRDTEVEQDWNNPHLLLQQYRKIDLDGDGYPEPYIVTVHKDTKKTVRIRANFHEDGVLKNKKGEVARIKCEEYYIAYTFIPSPDGAFYALGWGELLLSLNKTINATINKLVDSGTLASTSQGFLARGAKIKGGEQRFKPGEFKHVDTRGMPLKDSFLQIQHPEPSTVLFQLLGMLVDSAKSLGSLRDVLSGEAASNQSGIATLTLIEQGLTAFKSIYKRTYRSIKGELKLLYRLNSIYLDDVKYFNVMGDENAVAREDFDTNSVDVMPAADPTVVTDMQRIAKAQWLDSFRGDPNISQKELRQRMFEYIGEDGEELIIDAPPTPEDPMVEMQKMMLQVEEGKNRNEAYKAQIKAQETQAKIQSDQQTLQLKTAEAEHKAQVAEYAAQSKAQSEQAKIRSLMQDLAIKQADSENSNSKNYAEVMKIQAQTEEIEAKKNATLAESGISIETKQRELDSLDLEHQIKMGELQKALTDIQKGSEELGMREEETKALMELVELIKADRKDRAAPTKISVKKDSKGNITAEVNGKKVLTEVN